MSDTKKKLGLKPKTQSVKSEKLNQEQNDEEHHEEVENHVDEVDMDNDNEEFDEQEDEEEEQPSGIVLTGRVKWFNDRRGYGYITCITEGDFKDKDIFVHHTNVRPQESKYRTLYVNEYVQFYLGEADLCYDQDNNLVKTDYEHQATFVTGVLGGPLLCDGSFRPNARRSRDFQGGSNRDKSSSYGEQRYDDEEPRGQRQQRPQHQSKPYRNNSNNEGGRPRRFNDDNYQPSNNRARQVRHA